MVEGSQIDWVAHNDNADWPIGEVLGFDATVGVVKELVSGRRNTLVVIAADHETGGVAAVPGAEPGSVVIRCSGTGHTADPVPLFAFGDGSQLFSDTLANAAVGRRPSQVLQSNLVALGFPRPQ